MKNKDMFKAFEKIRKVIQSCEDVHQLIVANLMVGCFDKLFHNNMIDEESWTLAHMVSHKSEMLHNAEKIECLKNATS